MAKKKGKNKGGRPRKLIDYKRLDAMCQIHCTGDECAAILGMDYDTLNNTLKTDGHSGFSEYFKIKSAGGKMSLRRRQYTAAVVDGNPTMMIWMGKQWLGQTDKPIEESNAEPKALNITINAVDSSVGS